MKKIIGPLIVLVIIGLCGWGVSSIVRSLVESDSAVPNTGGVESEWKAPDKGNLDWPCPPNNPDCKG